VTSDVGDNCLLPCLIELYGGGDNLCRLVDRENIMHKELCHYQRKEGQTPRKAH